MKAHTVTHTHECSPRWRFKRTQAIHLQPCGEVRQALGAVRAEGEVDRVLARRLGARDRHESRVLLLASGDAVVEAAVGDRLALGGLSLGQARK